MLLDLLYALEQAALFIIWKNIYTYLQNNIKIFLSFT